MALLTKPLDTVRSLLRLYRGLGELYTYFDEATDKIQQATGQRVCIEHCGLCCTRTTPMVTKLEAEYLLGQLPELEVYEEIRERSLRWLVTEVPGLCSEKLPSIHALSQAQLGGLRADIHLLGSQPCPFLGNDLRCLVYNYRPLACRAYGTTLVQNEWCPRPLGPHETKMVRATVTSDTPLGQRIEASLAALGQLCREFLRDDLLTVGFLPRFVVESLARDKAQQLNSTVQQAKLSLGNVLPSMFSQ